MKQIPLPAEPTRWIPVAPATELGEGQAMERVVEGQLVAIFRHEGLLYGLEALCAHHGGPLVEGTVHEGCVTCPWHGWTYRLEDGSQIASGERLIRAYRVREQAGQIEVGWADAQ